MRIVFMGTPGFAATILENIAASQHQVLAAYTRPDAVRARGKQLVPSPVKQIAQAEGIAVRTPTDMRDPAVIEELAYDAPDVICVAAYGAILPPEVLDIPTYGCLNVHASLLPRWRGAAPVERAILAGDEYTGVSIMRMNEGLDTGDYCVVRTTEVASKDTLRLTAELAELGSAALLTALTQIEAGTVEWTPQDEFFATYANKIAKREFFVSPEMSADTIELYVQASSPAHPARCQVAGRNVTLVETQRVASRLQRADLSLGAGQVAFVSKQLYLGTSDHPVQVNQIKPDGKRTMEGAQFAAGLQGRDLSWNALDG